MSDRDRLQIRQVKTYTNADGKEVRTPDVIECEAPRAPANMNERLDGIDFFLDDDRLTPTADGGTVDGVTTTIETRLTFYRASSQIQKNPKLQLIYHDREVQLKRLQLEDPKGRYGYDATFVRLQR